MAHPSFRIINMHAAYGLATRDSAVLDRIEAHCVAAVGNATLAVNARDTADLIAAVRHEKELRKLSPGL